MPNNLTLVQLSRKKFQVEGVQVTATNIEAVAEWCGGTLVEAPEISHVDDVYNPYIKVEVFRPMNERQTKAFIGDWVLFAGKGYKVYTQKALDKSFEVEPVVDVSDI
jgi:hypothetical protein